MAAGLLALAQYIGIIVAMLVTPMLVGSDPSNLADYGTGFERMLWIYGIISCCGCHLQPSVYQKQGMPAG